MKSKNSSSKILDILKKIKRNQEYVNDSSLFNLGPKKPFYNTIPFILYCQSDCKPFIASGLFKDPLTNTFKCFTTPLFRINKIDENKEFIVLELLQPQSNQEEIIKTPNNNNVCQFFSSFPIKKLIRTRIALEININSFCGIECLPPINAKKEIPKEITNNNLKIKTKEYITISDGIKKVYQNSDGLEGFNLIPDPLFISYANLFVNGMLQPPSFYTYTEGELTLNVEEAPIKDSYLILQLITIST
ncbi:MAG: CotY/CotZ family spore coat protein [Bacilli bacterium]|jgi:hypothetical protein